MTTRQEVAPSQAAAAQTKGREEELVIRPPVDIFVDAHGIPKRSEFRPRKVEVRLG